MDKARTALGLERIDARQVPRKVALETQTTEVLALTTTCPQCGKSLIQTGAG